MLANLYLSYMAWVHFFLKLLELFGIVPCSILPDITLPSDIEGSTLDLNEEGGLFSAARRDIFFGLF